MQGKEYQVKAKATAHYPKENALYYVSLGLTGEAGEIANKVKKIIRDDFGKLTFKRKEELKNELGDLLWYLAMLAEELNLDLDEIMENNIKKLASRKERGQISGDGDNR